MDIDEYFLEVIPEIYEQYAAAHEKHVVFPTPGKSCEGMVMEELGEAVQAYNDGNYRHAVIEIDHTITTLLRWRKTFKETDHD